MSKFADNHSEGLRRAMTGFILVAHVTVGDETLIVKADEINKALASLGGTPYHGQSIKADITFQDMTEADFKTLPDLQ